MRISSCTLLIKTNKFISRRYTLELMHTKSEYKFSISNFILTFNKVVSLTKENLTHYSL